MEHFENTAAQYFGLKEFERISSKWSAFKAKTNSQGSPGNTEISKLYLEKFCFGKIILALEMGGMFCKQHWW